MKECNKFIDSLIPYYNLPDLISAEEVGIRKGWEAALGWVLNNYPDDAIYEIINKELKG